MQTHAKLTQVGLPRETLVPVAEEEEKQQPHVIEEWRSCCFRLSPPAIAYFGQIFTTFCITAISAYMLVRADGDCNKSAPYIGLISFMLGKILASVISSDHK
jgi:hypothetical protein